MRDLHRGPLRIVVTGCGRSGTRYMSMFLTKLGIPCGHESIFSLRSSFKWVTNATKTWLREDDRPTPIERHDFVPAGSLQADASWLAAPFASRLPARTLVLHQVRHPLKVIRSLLGTQVFNFELHPNSPYGLFADRCMLSGSPSYHPDDIRSEIERCMAYWVHWNWLAERVYRYGRRRYLGYRVEDLDENMATRICHLIGNSRPAPEQIDEALDLPTTIHSGPRLKYLDWGELPSGLIKRELEETVERYGYTR